MDTDNGRSTFRRATPHFSFQSLEVWNLALELSIDLLDLASNLNQSRDFAFSGQLSRAALSVPTNIAEGSGAFSIKEFAYFVSIARRSAFECASIVILAQRRGLVSNEDSDDLLVRIDSLSRRLTSFYRLLKARAKKRRGGKGE